MSSKSVAADVLGTARELAGNNKKTIWLGIGGLAAASWLGWIDLGLPGWWPIAAGALVAAYVFGREAAGRIDELLPDEDGILMVSYETERIDELSEDQFEAMTVAGSLYQWEESPRRTYECVHYDPEANHAVSNWKESFPGSEIGSEPTPADAIAVVEDFRESFEPELAKARDLKRRIRGIVRELEKERAEAQDSVLDEHVTPEVGGGRSVSRLLKEELPDDLHPFANRSEESPAADAEVDLDDSEDADRATDASRDVAAATDGGQTDG